MKEKYFLDNIGKLKIKIKNPFIIFLKGDLGAGKTTISKHILNNLLGVKKEVISPTYVYYNKYVGKLDGKKVEIYHFDLFRLKEYDEFFAIGGEDILDNNNGIILIEWSEVIENYYKADLEVILEKTNNDNERKIHFIYN